MNQPIYATLYLTNFTKSYVALIYQASAIIIVITKEQRKALSKTLKSEMKTNQVGTLQKKAYTRNFYERYAASYNGISKEQALSINSDCFEIPYSQLSALKLQPYKTHTTKMHQDEDAPGQIWFKTHNKEYHFNHKYVKDHPVISILQSGFKERFHLLRS